jgi:solute carrier family 35 protein E1
MVPIWIYYDLPVFLSETTTTAVPSKDEPPHSVIYYFFINGTVHYAQNIIAFVILSSTSPVTYSIASLIKRVAVICIAIVWFRQSVHPIQALGIVMTFAGLYMYNNAKGDVDKGEKKLRRMEAANDMMLPTTKADSRMMLGTESETISEHTNASAATMGSGTVYGRTWGGQSISGVGHQAAFSHQQHRPPASSFHIHTSKDMPLRKDISPLELYPSPPSSQDSPPSQMIPLPMEQPTHGFQQEPIPRYLHA